TSILVFGLSRAPIGENRYSSFANIALAGLGGFVCFLIYATHHKEKATRLVPILKHFFEGLSALPNYKSFFKILLESYWVWLWMVGAYILSFLAFGLSLHWSAGFVVMGIAAIGISIPGAPAAVGTYQLFVEQALALYGVSNSTGFAFSIVFQ